MIISIQKDLQEILQLIQPQPVFLIGCSECATICHTGGEKEIQDMKQQLEKNNISVAGWTILEPACNRQKSKKLLKKFKNILDTIPTILVFACGSGVQTVKNILPTKTILTGTNTLFLAEISRLTEFNKQCALCGDCTLNTFGGFCPISRCPKSMLNGPCGGAIQGKCEVDKNLDCVWIQIYQYFKDIGKIKAVTTIQKPKDWSQSIQTRRNLNDDI